MCLLLAPANGKRLLSVRRAEAVAKQAEFISFRISENMPADVRPLPDVDFDGPEPDEAGKLGVVVAIGRAQVEVQAILRPLRRVGYDEQVDPERCVAVGSDPDATTLAFGDLPAEHRVPE